MKLIEYRKTKDSIHSVRPFKGMKT